jgi:hypothetical protein
VAAWGADSGRSTVLLPLLCLFPFFCSLFCFFFFAMVVLLVAHGASGFSSDGEKDTREILQCLSSSLSIFSSSLSRLPSVQLPPPFVLSSSLSRLFFCFSLSVFLLSSIVLPPLQCSTSSGFYSQRMKAFSLCCCRDGVTAGVRHGSRETCPP